MNTNKEGFAPIAIVLAAIIGIAVVGGVSFYFYSANRPAPSQPVGGNNSPVASSTPIATPSSSVSSTLPKAPTSTTQNPGKKFALYPASGPVGTVVTINRSGFAATGNVVTLNGLTTASLKDLSSADGKTIKFTLPENIGPNCKADEACAQYLALVSPGENLDVVVISDGVSYEIGSFTVTGN